MINTLLFALNKSTMIWLVVFLITLCVIFYFKVKQKQSYWSKKGIKHLKPTFFCGNISIRRNRSFAEKFQDIYNAFPEERYHGVYQFLEPVLVVKDPNLIKQITVKEFDHFVDHRTIVSGDLDPFWGKNLFSSKGDRWRDLRSTLSPSFTSSKMKFMYKLMEECAQHFVEYFLKDQSEIVEVEMKDAFTRYTNDVIATTAFGLKCDSLKNKNNEFYLMGKDGSDFSGFRQIKFFFYDISPLLFRLLRMQVTPVKVSKYFSKIVEETVRVREEKNIVRPDMIHLLMESRKERQQNSQNKKEELTLEDMTAQAFIFFLAGFDTASSLITFIFYELAVNPDIQTRLREEILTISDNLNYESLLNLTYMHMVVSETLRKWPPAIITDRKVTKEFTIQPERPGEVPLTLEEGKVCWLVLYGLHRDPKNFPDPEKFDPERFNEDNKHNINPFVYIPFGSGPRNCIGSRFALLETKLILYYMLKNFEVVPIAKTKIPLVLDKNQPNLTAEGGMWLGLKKFNQEKI